MQLTSPEIRELFGRIQSYFTQLSPRERLLILGMALVVSLVCLWVAIESTAAVFERQEKRISELERELRKSANAILKYEELQEDRAEVEERFQEVQFQTGALSYLESLLENKVKAPRGSFTIRDLQSSPFGGGYRKKPYSIEFQTKSMEKIVALVQELVQGEKRMLLSELEIEKTRRRDRLDVEIEVSTINREDNTA